MEGHNVHKTMSSASNPCQTNLPTTSYRLTLTTILQILILAFLRILKSLLATTYILIQKLITLVVKRPRPSYVSVGSGEKNNREAAAVEGKETRQLEGLRRLAGVTLTITVSIGAVRLIVVTVTVVALTLWVPLYSSARAFFTFFDRVCRSGRRGPGGCGFVVDVRVGP